MGEIPMEWTTAQSGELSAKIGSDDAKYATLSKWLKEKISELGYGLGYDTTAAEDSTANAAGGSPGGANAGLLLYVLTIDTRLMVVIQWIDNDQRGGGLLRAECMMKLSAGVHLMLPEGISPMDTGESGGSAQVDPYGDWGLTEQVIVHIPSYAARDAEEAVGESYVFRQTLDHYTRATSTRGKRSTTIAEPLQTATSRSVYIWLDRPEIPIRK
jgi:hypothetical protein